MSTNFCSSLHEVCSCLLTRVAPEFELCIVAYCVPCTPGLSHEESGPAAALAFKHLCDACKALLAPSLEALMQLYHRIQPSGDAVDEGASRPEGLAVDEDAVQQVVPIPSVPMVLRCHVDSVH